MNNENKLVIEQINKFGKVPQRYELLQMIEQLHQENQQLKENYDRIYNENCKLREEHNITDISLLDENYKLKKEIDILLNVQEEYEKSLHKIRELKRELNKVNDENKRLKEQIDVYENPEDMFLMMMWCTEEVKDENEKLQQEVNYLSKEVGRWNSYYDDEFNENLKLKKQLEEWKHHLKCSKEMLDIQGQKGNYDYDEYMLGLYNGMEYVIALFETREPNYINGKDVEFINNKIQQKYKKIMECE